MRESRHSLTLVLFDCRFLSLVVRMNVRMFEMFERSFVPSILRPLKPSFAQPFVAVVATSQHHKQNCDSVGRWSSVVGRRSLVDVCHPFA